MCLCIDGMRGFGCFCFQSHIDTLRMRCHRLFIMTLQSKIVFLRFYMCVCVQTIKNRHRDMVEYFLFLSGNGIIRLDQRNHTIVRDSFVVVYPPMKHTIFNTGRVPIELLVVASVP